MDRLGELAAFGTAVFWTGSALFFENASRRIGALAVNFYKVVAAFVLLALAGLVLRGQVLPLDATAFNWGYLSLSGLIGFVVADYFLFNAYILIGSRLTVLFQPLSPLFTALLSFLILGERMRPTALLAMAIVLGGIVVVLVSRSRQAGREGSAALSLRGNPRLLKGLAFALASAFFNALGLIFSKKGLADGYSALAGTQIRVMTAIVGFGLQALLFRQAREVFVEAPRNGAGMKATAGGSVFGPFLGVTLSLFAIQNTSAGAASTLMALTPVLIIPPAALLLKHRITLGEIIGACIAVSGAALFFLL